MKTADYLQLALYLSLLILCTPLLGTYLAKVFEGKKNILTPIIGKLEDWTYRLCGVDEKEGMGWWEYTKALLWFNFFGFIVVFVLQLFQAFLPLNPAKLGNISWDLAFNTAVSFISNTNWQSYSGENTLSYLSQMLGLAVQNFLSAATGIAVLVAFTRGLVNKSTASLGNFWQDLVRSLYYVLIPASIILALLLCSQGVVQSFSQYKEITTLQGEKQVLPLGPAASQIAIKQLGTNGGGFFGVNSAHPFENPTPLANFLEMFALLLIPAASVYAFGVMIKNRRHAWLLFSVMLFLFIAGLGISLWSEYSSITAKAMRGLRYGA